MTQFCRFLYTIHGVYGKGLQLWTCENQSRKHVFSSQDLVKSQSFSSFSKSLGIYSKGWCGTRSLSRRVPCPLLKVVLEAKHRPNKKVEQLLCYCFLCYVTFFFINPRPLILNPSNNKHLRIPQVVFITRGVFIIREPKRILILN